MAFDPLLKEEAPLAAPPVDPMASVNAELAKMREQMLAIDAAYKANKNIPQVQPVYVPVPQVAQQPEPQLTEADFFADIPNAVRAEAERIAAAREAALRDELGSHLGVIYEKNFERDVKELSQHPYYKAVESQLQEFIAANPSVKYSPGALTSKFHELVGAQAVSRPIAEAEQVERVRAVEPVLPSTSSPLPTSATRKEPLKLDDDREALRQMFNSHPAFKLNMSAEEWDAIESKKILRETRD